MMNTVKNKFHLAKRNGARYSAPSSPVSSGPSGTVALVDERYLSWLASQQPAASGARPALHRHALVPVFSILARLCGPDASLTRVCLFADHPPAELLDDVILRTVPQHSADGGLGMVRALGLELTQLAQRGGCQFALVASDDERLIPYIDEAQWRGVKVVLITDESSQDFGRLMGDDPSWARLLMQADRRLSLNESAWQALITGQAPATSYFAARSFETEPAREPEMPPASEASESTEPPSDDWRAQVERVIRDWWAEETPHARLDLFEEMQNSQGVPPETDRHLLLRVRRELARTLSFPEKKAMREMIRATVLAQPPAVDEPVDS